MLSYDVATVSEYQHLVTLIKTHSSELCTWPLTKYCMNPMICTVGINIWTPGPNTSGIIVPPEILYLTIIASPTGTRSRRG